MTGIVPQTTSPTTQSVSQASQTSPPDAINDLCMFFKPSPPRRPRSGSISSASGLSVQLSPQANRVSTLTSVKLTEVFAQRKTLTNRERVELALTLALAVLQISCTNWMKGKWTSDHLLLVTDASRKMHPYIVHRFQSSRRGSIESTLAPPTVNQVADWIKNISLFALGVFLLEVCFNQSIEDLATPKEKQSNGDPWPYTPLLTAKRLSKAVQDHLGLHYAQAVSACLDAPDIDMDQAGEPKNSTQFEKSIQKNIVGPLKALSEMFS